jgi:hypothetical protein
MLSAFVVDLDHGRSLAAMWHALRASNFGYRNGVEIDAGIVHALLNARYYDPARGQFLSEDPSFLAVGDPNAVKQVTGQDQRTFLSDPRVSRSIAIFNCDFPAPITGTSKMAVNATVIRRAVFALAEGDVVIEFPRDLSKRVSKTWRPIWKPS